MGKRTAGRKKTGQTKYPKMWGNWKRPNIFLTRIPIEEREKRTEEMSETVMKAEHVAGNVIKIL